MTVSQDASQSNDSVPQLFSHTTWLVYSVVPSRGVSTPFCASSMISCYAGRLNRPGYQAKPTTLILCHLLVNLKMSEHFDAELFEVPCVIIATCGVPVPLEVSNPTNRAGSTLSYKHSIAGRSSYRTPVPYVPDSFYISTKILLVCNQCQYLLIETNSWCRYWTRRLHRTHVFMR